MALSKLMEARKSRLAYSKSTRQLIYVLVEFLFIVTLLIVANISIFIDATILRNSLSEASITQYLQGFLILSSSVIFCIGAVRHPLKRGYLAIVTTLFFIMFIRENDALLDLV